MKHYYARISPRGFANEYSVHRFDSIAARDAFVDAEHCSSRGDGRQDNPSKRCYPIKASEARGWDFDNENDHCA